MIKLRTSISKITLLVSNVNLEKNVINLIRKREADCLPPFNRDGDYEKNTDGEGKMNKTFQQWKQECEMSDLDNSKLVLAFVDIISCLYYYN